MTRKVHIVLKDSVASDAAQREEALRRIEHHYHVTSQTPPDRLEYGIVTALANPAAARDGYFIGIGFAVPIGTAGGAGNVPQK